MPFKIQFEGLFCHIGTAAEKTHVTIVKAHGHKPTIFISSNDLIGSPNDFNETLHDGDLVTFSLPPGTAKLRDGTVDRYVPHLESLLEDSTTSNKDLHGEVKRKMPHPNVVAHMIYPEGTLSALKPQKKMLKFTPADGGTSWQQCVADSVEFQTNTSDIVTMTIAHHPQGQRTVNIKPNAIVRFLNSLKGNHFHHYKDLTKASKMASVQAGDACPEAAFRVNPDPECTNSQWP